LRDSERNGVVEKLAEDARLYEVDGRAEAREVRLIALDRVRHREQEAVIPVMVACGKEIGLRR
jgi:hypothetical protein